MNRLLALAVILAAGPLSAHGGPRHRRHHRPVVIVSGPGCLPRPQGVRVRPWLPPRPRIVFFR